MSSITNVRTASTAKSAAVGEGSQPPKVHTAILRISTTEEDASPLFTPVLVPGETRKLLLRIDDLDSQFHYEMQLPTLIWTHS
jgi:hypothetical protein